MRTAVLGHVEWVEFLRVPHMPRTGEIVHATEWYEFPAGGGAAAAVQLRKLAGNCLFLTAFGDDEIGSRAAEELREMGVDVAAPFRPTRSRRAVTHVDAAGERTITVIGERLSASASDDLPWDELSDVDCIYVTGDDPASTRLARAAHTVVSTARVLPSLQAAAIRLDGLVASSTDASERYEHGDLDPPPELVAITEGADGGRYWTAGGQEGRWEASSVPGPVVDRYGAGDAFAAGLTYALGRGDPPQQACDFAARCGASVLAGRGPYETQMTLP
jgi:ribokinase